MSSAACHSGIAVDPRQAAQADIRALRARISELDEGAFELILTRARTHYSWQDRPVTEGQLRRLYDITKMGSTSMNCSPARFFFLVSPEAKQPLVPALKAKNVEKMMNAPVTVVIANDLRFWERLDYLFPHDDRKPLFRGKEDYVRETAARNATLQGAYMMIAARGMGLDCGPMSGFDNAIVDEAMFAGTSLRSNFLLNLGYADETAVFPRLPRLPFEEACRIM